MSDPVPPPLRTIYNVYTKEEGVRQVGHVAFATRSEADEFSNKMLRYNLCDSCDVVEQPLQNAQAVFEEALVKCVSKGSVDMSKYDVKKAVALAEDEFLMKQTTDFTRALLSRGLPLNEVSALNKEYVRSYAYLQEVDKAEGTSLAPKYTTDMWYAEKNNTVDLHTLVDDVFFKEQTQDIARVLLSQNVPLDKVSVLQKDYMSKYIDLIKVDEKRGTSFASEYTKDLWWNERTNDFMQGKLKKNELKIKYIY